MKKQLITCLILVLMVSGCAIKKFHKDDTSQAQFERDKYDCQAKNRTATPVMMLVDMGNVWDCMKYEKGYEYK